MSRISQIADCAAKAAASFKDVPGVDAFVKGIIEHYTSDPAFGGNIETMSTSDLNGLKRQLSLDLQNIRNQLSDRNAFVKNGTMSFKSNTIEPMKAAGKGIEPMRILLDKLQNSTDSSGKGSSLNVNQFIENFKDKYRVRTAMMEVDPKIFKALAKGDRATTSALFDSVFRIERDLPLVETNPKMREMAELYHRINERLLGEAQANGIDRKNLTGRGSLLSVNGESVRAESKQQYIEKNLPRLDPKFKNGNIDLQRLALRDNWEYHTQDRQGLIEQGIQEGKSTSEIENIARGQLASRALMFKDGPAFSDYMSDYSDFNALTSIEKDISRTGRDLGINRFFGPDAANNLEKAQQFGKAAIDSMEPGRAKDKALGEWQDLKKKQDLLMQKALGNPASKYGLADKIVDVGIQQSVFSKAMDAFISHATGNFPREMAILSSHMGSGFVENGAKLAQAMSQYAFKGLAGMEDQKNAYSLFSWARESVLRDGGSFGNDGVRAYDAPPDSRFSTALKKTSDAFSYTLNALNQMTRSTMARVAQTDLGRASEKTFDQLTPNQRVVFDRYGMDAKDWEILRKATVEVPGGQLAIDPMRITPEMAGTHALALDLQYKASALLGDMVDGASGRTSWRERYAFGDPNSAGGAAARMVMLFHNFFLRSANQLKTNASIASEANPGLLNSNGAAALQVKTAVALLGGAYVNELIKSGLKNQTMPNMDHEFWTRLVAESGALGMLGAIPGYAANIAVQSTEGLKSADLKTPQDFLANVAEHAAGPVLGNLYQGAKALPKKNGQFADWASRQLPFVNEAAIRTTVNAAFYDRFMEQHYPGYSTRKESYPLSQGRHYIINDLRPTEAAKP